MIGEYNELRKNAFPSNDFNKSCKKYNAHLSIYLSFVVIYSIQLSLIVSRVSMRTSTPSSHHSHNWRCGVMADDYINGCGDDDET